MTVVIELADDPDLTGWTELTEVKRETLRCGGIANKTEVGMGSGFDWYDDAGVRDLPGRRPIRVIETSTTPDTTLFRGRVSVKNLARGVIVTEDAKQFGVALDDYNQDLRGIVVNAWIRPEETDVARVHALRNAYLRGAASTSSRARTSTDLDDTYIAAAPTVLLPAERYDSTDPAGVLSAICESTGKEGFVTVDGEIFYDTPTSTAYASTYSITDVAPDGIDELEPMWEGPAATEDPSELLSGAFAKYGFGSGSVTESRPAVEALFDKWEQAVHFDLNSAANAALQLDALLDNQGIEEKSRRVSVMVPEDQVDRIKWGQTISFRAAASGDLSPVTLRISYLLWEVPISPEAPYIAHLELVKPKKIAPRVKKGPTPKALSNGLQEQNQALYPYCVLTYQRETFTRVVGSGLGDSEFDGNPPWTTTSSGSSLSVDGGSAVLEGSVGARASSMVAVGLTGVIEILVKCEADDPTFDGSSGGFFWISNVDFASSTGTQALASINVIQTGAPLAVGTTVTMSLYVPNPGSHLSVQLIMTKPIALSTGPIWCRMLIDGQTIKGAFSSGGPPGGSIWDDEATTTGTPNAGAAILEVSSAVDETFRVDDISVIQGMPIACLAIGSFSAAPVPGQEIEEDLGFGDGTNVTFDLDYDAAPGSLDVDVDGTDQTEAVTYSEGDTFYLSFAPEADERITVSYKRAA